MLAASLTATQTTSAANAASIAPPTANNRTNNNNIQSKKIVLYNPTIDYSAPLQQQINPDIIGAHPHAQQYQQQSGLSSSNSAGGGTVSTIHNTNQVRLPLQQVQQQTQQQSRLSAFTPVAATRLSLAGLAAAAATNTITQSNTTVSSSQQQQQQQILATLPLKLSEQCNLSNLHLNSFVSEMSPIKTDLEQQQNQHNNNNNNQVVGLLGRNGDAKGLLVNNSVGSSISNLIISNNLTTNATTITATGAGTGGDAAETANNKLNALWGQPPSSATPYNIAGTGNPNANHLYSNATNTSDAISSLWGCTSSSASIGSSSTSGCSIGSGSQPSLSPTSSTSARPDYRGNCKEPLWSTLQTLPTSSNNLRETYYTTKSGVAINAANALVGAAGAIRNGASNATDNGQQSNSPSASSTCSSTSSSASSTCSSGLGSSAGIDVGVWPNSKLQSYFATTDNCGNIVGEEHTQFAKISNIWDIANPTTPATTTRTSDLFNDLWCNNNTAATTTKHGVDLAEPIDFNGTTSIWGTSAAINGANVAGRAHIKPTTGIGGNNSKVLRTNLSLIEGENSSVGVGLGAEAGSGAACMQLFSEQFLNYMNIINYAD